MSSSAIVFMILTMGGVLGLNVLCIVFWLTRGGSSAAPPAPGTEPPRADDAPKPAGS